MERVDIINYWRGTLCGGQYCKNVKGEECFTMEKKEIVCIKYDISKSMKQVKAYTEKERLKEFISLYALYQTISRFTGEEKIGLMVPCKTGYFPMVVCLKEKRTVKEDIQELYEAYKSLYMVSQQTTKELEKYLTPEERNCIQGQGHLKFGFHKPVEEAESVSIENGILQYRIWDQKDCGGLQMELQAKTFLRCYETMLGSVVKQLKEQGQNRELELLSKEDRQQILQWSCGKKTKLKTDIPLYQQFLRWVYVTPEKTAVTCGKEQMTYKELQRKVQQICHQLLEKGIAKHAKVAVISENSCNTIASMLAIWAIGAVYVPIGNQFALEKVKNILELAKANLLLLPKQTEVYHGLTIPMCVAGEAVLEAEEELPVVANEELHIIFTSGTTGNPKAVAIENTGFQNLCNWYAKEYQFTQNARTLLLTNYTFDASVKNMIVPLITGGELHLVPTTLYDVDTINQIIEERKITHINCVPSLLDSMLEAEKSDGYRRLESLTTLIIGGEKFPMDVISCWLMKDKKKRLISNVYGPTEATDLSNFHHLKEEELSKAFLSIGRPLDNKQVYILESDLSLCPCYKTGMLYISGTGVIRHYMGDSVQTDKFKTNPYQEREILYCTGDLGRWNAAGEIEYVGRSDNQVKLNGQRVELEEIENVAKLCATVKQSAAILRNTGDSRIELVLYYNSKAGGTVKEEELKIILKRHLSPSIQPNKCIEIQEFPLNANGKIDRKALASRTESENSSSGKIVEPRTELEQKIKESWVQILGRTDISINTPFFEAGGNSLRLNQLKFDLEKRIDCNIRVTDLFEFPTIERMAKYIERGTEWKA